MPTDEPDILDYKSIRDPKKLDEIPIDAFIDHLRNDNTTKEVIKKC